ncbi:SDR family NAD(P)-dependent oxidoreductase [Jeotgalibacillus soli]|uniref:Ketoreductase domain-containing protein n=1 Tax=Jeotgalibacillus soli TaxID=889306 RepID=A0A0C2VTB1_9BACL|nr:SDR family oxidoreductase [Jeotgalibacillus soli]KIL47243.1 hypothetical protein KP78_18160 [Jeotgalibacillus soli]
MKRPIALVTGAGTGLGKELALSLSRSYHMILVGRRVKPLVELEASINALNGTASSVACDVTMPEQLRELINKLRDSEMLPIDLVVNNAGVGYFGSLESMDMEEWDLMFRTNVLGPMALTKALVPYMKEEKSGMFLNILSTAALRGKVNESGYVASKFALRGFSESIAQELKPFGIRVVRAYMGGMNTPFWEGSTHVDSPEIFRTPKEVADIIVENMHDQDEIIIESKR